MTIKRKDTDKITVCEYCFRAACIQGLAPCDHYPKAGTVEKTVGELRELGLEHHDYWVREDK